MAMEYVSHSTHQTGHITVFYQDPLTGDKGRRTFCPGEDVSGENEAVQSEASGWSSQDMLDYVSETQPGSNFVGPVTARQLKLSAMALTLFDSIDLYVTVSGSVREKLMWEQGSRIFRDDADWVSAAEGGGLDAMQWGLVFTNAGLQTRG